MSDWSVDAFGDTFWVAWSPNFQLWERGSFRRAVPDKLADRNFLRTFRNASLCKCCRRSFWNESPSRGSNRESEEALAQVYWTDFWLVVIRRWSFICSNVAAAKKASSLAYCYWTIAYRWSVSTLGQFGAVRHYSDGGSNLGHSRGSWQNFWNFSHWNL